MRQHPSWEPFPSNQFQFATSMPRDALDSASAIRVLKYVENVHAVLVDDVIRSYGSLTDDKDRSPEQHAFWHRSASHALFSTLEGGSYAMRRSVLLFGGSVVTLDKETRAKLGDQRYDKKRDRVLEAKIKTQTKESVKLAFRHFPKLFGASYELETQSRGWEAIISFLKARRRLTHPTTFDDFLPDGIEALESAVLWYLPEIDRLLTTCRSSVSNPEELPPRTSVDAQVKSLGKPVFDEETLQLIGASAGKSMVYFRKYFAYITKDLQRSSELLFREQLDDPASSSSEAAKRIGFARRNFVRTSFAVLEGVMNGARFFLESGRDRGQFEIADDEAKAFTSGPLVDRFPAVLESFSRHVGYGRSPTGGKRPTAFVKAIRIRDRLAHPQLVRDLEMTDDKFGRFLRGHVWAIQALECLLFDKEKLPAADD